MSVESVSKTMGIQHQGRFNDAIADAEITAMIALRIFDDLNGGIFILNENNDKPLHFKIKENC